MKILYHHRIGSRDGQSVHMDELIKALRDLGHTVIVVGPHQVTRIKFGGETSLSAVLRRRLPPALYELLELAYNLPAFWRLHRAVTRHRPDALYERYSLFLLAGRWERRLRSLPSLLEVNGPLFEERSEHDGLALKGLGRWCQQANWRNADAVLPVTAVLAEYVRRAGVPPARITVIPNGIDPDRFAAGADREAAKRALGLSGRLVVGFAGFLRSWHRLDAVVHMLARPTVPADVHLLVIGDGPARTEIEAAAQAAGFSNRMSLVGVIERDVVPTYLAAIDIALQPGVTGYASPLKLFEYMALGLAVVAPAMPNIGEVLTHEQDGLLFDPDDPEAMFAAIRRLIKDPGLRHRLGENARQRIAAGGFTWHRNAERVVTLIEAVQRDRQSSIGYGEGKTEGAPSD